jgi:hypothetical protein
MISRVIYFLIIIFCINTMIVGLGLAEMAEIRLTEGSVIDVDPSDLGTVPTNIDILYVDVGDPDTIVSSPFEPDFIPESTTGYSGMKTIAQLGEGLLFGWAYVLFLLRFPPILLYGVLGVVGVLQVFCVFYLIMYAINALRGRL